MKTIITKNDTDKAAKILLSGGFVSVPTETVYGLAVNALNEKAVEKLYEVKGRPAIKPLSIMVSGKEDIEKYCENVPEQAYKLADKYWPGPLTIIMKASKVIPPIVRAGGESIGLRCPNSQKTLDIIKRAGIPLAVPSANPSGLPSPKNAETVHSYFDGKIEMIVDGGICDLGIESTLIDMTVKPYRILREGALPETEIANTLVENLKVFGITGGSGTGKTTALKFFEKKEAVVIDCDALYHELLDTDAELNEELVKNFPGAEKNGKINRKLLGNIVFNDGDKLSILNKITHKHVSESVDKIITNAAMCGKKIVVIDAYAIIESGISKKCSAIIGVTAETEIRINRIIKRDNISKEEAQLRINAQNDDAFYFNNCDYVIENNTTEVDFSQKLEKVYKEEVVDE